MKSLHSRLASITPFVFFPLLIIMRKGNKICYLFLVLLSLSLTGCYLHFFNTNTRSTIDTRTLQRLKTERKYFIIHFFNATYGVENLRVEGETLRGRLVPLPEEHAHYLHPSSVTKNRIKKKDKPVALMEVHLYTDANNKEGNTELSTNMAAFNRSDIYEFNQMATRRNHILSTVGVVATVLGAMAGVALIVLAISCNCPQVYMENNGNYTFASGLYSGAFYSTLERTDYLPLTQIPAGSKTISFKIANAKDEEQFINHVELLRIDHPANIKVLSDRHGNVFSYTPVSTPHMVLIKGNNKAGDMLANNDHVFYAFDNSANENGLSDMIIKFKKSEAADKPKLLIHARNSYWSGLLHKEFINYFGENFDQWRANQEKADPKKLEKSQTDQALPLMVYLKTTEGWKFLDYFPLVGNTATRDMIMEINVAAVEGQEVELKLETAYRFWDIDYAGISYGSSAALSKTILQPLKIISSDSVDVRNLLDKTDKQYLHLTDEQAVYFSYPIAPAPQDMQSSYFLVSGGYYHSLQHMKGKANFAELSRFQKKGAFDKFSREKYQQSLDIASMFTTVSK